MKSFVYVEVTQIHLGYGGRNTWKHGSPLWMRFMRKGASSFANFGMLGELPNMVKKNYPSLFFHLVLFGRIIPINGPCNIKMSSLLRFFGQNINQMGTHRYLVQISQLQVRFKLMERLPQTTLLLDALAYKKSFRLSMTLGLLPEMPGKLVTSLPFSVSNIISFFS